MMPVSQLILDETARTHLVKVQVEDWYAVIAMAAICL